MARAKRARLVHFTAKQIQTFNHRYFCGNISINKQWCRNTICRRLSIAGKQESDKNYPPDETRTASESVAAAEKWNEETALSPLNLSVGSFPLFHSSSIWGFLKEKRKVSFRHLDRRLPQVGSFPLFRSKYLRYIRKRKIVLGCPWRHLDLKLRNIWNEATASNLISSIRFISVVPFDYYSRIASGYPEYLEQCMRLFYACNKSRVSSFPLFRSSNIFKLPRR